MEETPQDQQEPKSDIELFMREVVVRLRLVWRYFNDFTEGDQTRTSRYNIVQVEIDRGKDKRTELGKLVRGMFIDQPDAYAIEDCLYEVQNKALELFGE